MTQRRGPIAALFVSVGMMAGGAFLASVAALGIVGWATILAGLGLLMAAAPHARPNPRAKSDE